MEESGNWHYEFHSVDTQTASSISSCSGIEVAGWHNTISSEAGYSIKEQPVAISAQNKSVFEKIFLNGITEGEYPDTPNEIAISSSLKSTASVSLNGTVELYKPDGSTADYLVVGFLDDTETPCLISDDMSIAVMTPEGLGTLAFPDVNESYVVQFSRLCNIPDTINDVKASNNLSDEQIIGNYILMTGAFVVCITLFLSFSTLVDFMKNAFVPPVYTPELSIASETNTFSIGNELLEQIRQNDVVKRAYGRMFAYNVPAEYSGKSHNANLISYEENQ